MTVSDVGETSNLKIASVNLTVPKVVCPPRLNSAELYVKFSVFNKKTQYDFDVVFHQTGYQDFIYGSIFEHVFCVLLAVATIYAAYVWLRKSINDKDFDKFNEVLARRRAAQLPSDEIKEEQIEDRLNALAQDDSIDSEEDMKF